jgi:outer membrane protein insertion porin family
MKHPPADSAAACGELHRRPGRSLPCGRIRAARAGAGLWLAAAVLACAPLPARAQQAGPAEPPKIESIDFPGAGGVSPGRLRGAMRLRQHTWWKPFQKNRFYGTDHLERDLERVLALYREEGFVFARVEEALVRYLARDRVALEIRVSEGPRVLLKGVRVSGVDDPLRADLQKQVTLSPGTPLGESRLQAEEDRLLRACQEEGHALAAINREVRFQGDSAEVWLWVEKGPRVRIDRVQVSGVQRTDTTVVTREVGLRRGEVLRRSKVLGAQERLFDLGLFRSVRILPAYPDSVPEIAARSEIGTVLNVVVAERAPGWIAVGGGVSSAEQVQLVGEWGYRNLFGRAHGIMLRALVAFAIEDEAGDRVLGAKERKFELNYSQPSFFGWRLHWQVNPYYRFLHEPTFEEDIYGLVIGGHRTLGRYERLVGSFENKWISTTDTTAGRPDYQTRFLSLALIDDRRDSPLDPQRGHLVQVRAEHAGGFLGGAASFARWTAGASYYLPLSRHFTWAARAQAGYISQVGRGVGVVGEERELLRVPFDERFRAGGGTTVRGYEEKSLGPRTSDGQALGGLALLMFNTEVRFPIFWQFAGAVFLDAGNVWEDYRQITWSSWGRGWSGGSYSELNAAYSVGAGLRWRTPVGPLRLDYGVKVNPNRRPGTEPGQWHFSLGQAY